MDLMWAGKLQCPFKLFQRMNVISYILAYVSVSRLILQAAWEVLIWCVSWNSPLHSVLKCTYIFYTVRTRSPLLSEEREHWPFSVVSMCFKALNGRLDCTLAEPRVGDGGFSSPSREWRTLRWLINATLSAAVTASASETSQSSATLSPCSHTDTYMHTHTQIHALQFRCN